MSRIFKVIFVLPLLFVFAQDTFSADWTTFRGNPEHSGVSTETIAVPLEKKWDFSMGGSKYSSPIVAGGVVFVGSNDHYVYAVGTASATLKWKYQTGDSVESTPLYYNGTVYVGSSDGFLYALNATNGSLLWSFNAGSAISSSPVTDGTNIYFAAQSGDIFAVSMTTHNAVWASPYNVPGGFSYPSAALVLSKQYNALFIGSEEGSVYAINTNGTTKWVYPTGANPGDNRFSVSSPAVVGGTVYIGSDNGIVYAITASNGSLSWSYNVGNDVLSSPAVTDSTVYFGSIAGNFYALGTSGGNKGKLLWSSRIAGTIKSSAVVSGNTVFVGSTNLFFALDATTGDFKWSYGVGQEVASPAISNGIVYLVSDRLYAFEATTTLVAMIEKWKYNTGVTISMSGVAVDGGITYIGADDGKLYSLNSDGTLKWSYPTNGGMISSTPVVSGGVVYFGARDNNTFYAVNTADGTLKWNKTLTGSGAFISSTPTVVGSVIYVGAHDGKLYALNSTDGSQVWLPYATAGGSSGTYNLSTPIVDNGKIYFAYANSAVVVLDQTTGSKLWEKQLSGFNSSSNSTKILLDGASSTLYVGGVDRVYALDIKQNGNFKWSQITNGVMESGFALWEGILVGGSRNSVVYAWTAATGAPLWQYSVKGQPGTPFLWQDVVFVMTNGYRVYALNAENGQLRFEYSGNFSPLTPVITGGILYLGSRDGRIYSEDIDHYAMNISAATGGTIMTVYGDRLQIPPGALAANTTVTIGIAPNDQVGGGVVALPRKYQFGPGTSFLTPATVKFAYKTSDLNGTDPGSVKVYVWDSTTSTWTASGGTADLTNKTIDVSLDHFSDYALFGGEPELNFPVLAASYLYGTPVTFKFSAFDPTVITNVTGFLNGQSIESGTQVKLTKLGTNTFRVVGTKAGGQEVSQSITFEVAYAFEWLSPLTTATFTAGETIPIKFKTEDFAGNFVGDGKVTVEVIDQAGQTTGIFSSGKGNLYIKISESHYLVNFDTNKYPWIVSGGTYQIKISFGSYTYPPYSFTVR